MKGGNQYTNTTKLGNHEVGELQVGDLRLFTLIRTWWKFTSIVGELISKYSRVSIYGTPI